MLRDEIAPLIINGSDACPIKEDCPQVSISCKICLTNKVLELCRKEIGEVFKEYEVTPLRKEFIKKMNDRFAGFEIEGGQSEEIY